MEGRLVSPNEMHQAACDLMLGGLQPASEHDWVLVINFYAANIASDVQPSGLLLMAHIMGCPLSDEFIRRVSKFQAQQRQADKAQLS